MKNIREKLLKLQNDCNLRTLKEIDTKGKYIRIATQKLLNTASNDYLGIASQPFLQKEFFEIMQQSNKYLSFGGASSRLLSGNSREYRNLESYLKVNYQKEGALIFNSGYHANIGIIPALAGKNDLIFADKSVHASLIDGFRLSETKFVRYRHCDYEHLERLLEKYSGGYKNIFIVSESVFSMSGNVANLQELVRIKKKFDAFLYVDEAHGFGVFGENGFGVAEEQNCIQDIDVLMGTFGKAAGSQGAFAVFSSEIEQLLVNKMRSLIFTTALPPINLAWTLFTLQKISQMQDERNHLKKISKMLRDGLRISGKKTEGNSQIIPYITGSNKSCVEAANYLKKNRIWAMPVRTPTVQIGSELVRFSLTANMNEDDINLILNGL